MAFVSSCSGIVVVDSRTNSGTITLPAASTLIGRSLIFKDGFNSFGNNSLTLSTMGVDAFENSNNTLTVNTNNGFVQLVAGSNVWYTVSGDLTNLQLISTMSRLLTENTCVAAQYDVNNSNIFAVTSDGYNWTSSINNTFTATVFGLAWNGAYWLAVGSGSNTIGISPDGYRWTSSINNPFSNGYGNKVAWNGSYWVAVGDNYVNTNIAVSSNGYNWTPASNNLFAESYGAGIAWNGSYWVAVGKDVNVTNTIIVSSDGYNWTSSSNNPFSLTGSAIAWNGSYWLAGGNGANTIALSSNGYNWTPSSNNPFSQGCTGLAWNGVYWVAIGVGVNSIAVSTDGYNWSTSSNNPYVGYYPTSITWNGSDWITLGFSDLGDIISISHNGYNWNSFVNKLYNSGYRASAIASRRVLPYVGLNIAGGGGDITNLQLTSTVIGLGTLGYISSAGGGGDVTNLQLTSTVEGLGTLGYISSAGGGGGDVTNLQLTSTVIGLGTVGYISSLSSLNSLNSIKASTIELTYNQLLFKEYSTSFEQLNGIAYGNGIWVAGGSNTGAPYTLQTSSNGFDWTTQVAEGPAQQNTLRIQTVRFLNSTFFAGGYNASLTSDNSSIITSVDGSNWTAGSTISADIYDFGYNSSFYLACGTLFSTFEGNATEFYYTLFKSIDSSNWLQQEYTNMTIGYGITYASSIWVMVGSTINNNGIEKSINASNWTTIASSNIYVPNIPNVNNSTFTYMNYIGNKVAYNSSIWVTAGRLALSNTADVEDTTQYDFPVLVSYDANTWFAPSSLLISENVNNTGTSVLWSGSNWIVGLNNDVKSVTLSSIITSPDGLNWTYQTTATGGLVTSIAKSDSFYIAGKYYGAVIAALEYSFNGLDWVSGYTLSTINSTIITSQCNALVINGSTLSYTDNIIDSKIDNLGSLTYVSTTYLAGEIDGLGTLGYISSSGLASTVEGLGTLGYISSAGGGGGIQISDLVSTVEGLGSLGYISSAGGGGGIQISDLVSTVEGLGTYGYISTMDLVSTVEGLGTYGYISTMDLVSTVDGLGTYGYISSSGLASTVEGLGTLGYISSAGGDYISTIVLPTESMCIALSQNINTIAVTYDGYNWNVASNHTCTQPTAVAWNGAHWIVVGESIILSSDGYNWTSSINNPFSGTNGRGIAWNGSYWVTVGSNVISVSTDGYNWSPSSNNPLSDVINAVAWNGSYWLAAGNGAISIAVSTDGYNWLAASNNTFGSGNGAYDIAWNGSYWVAAGGGSNNPFSISTDGYNWLAASNNVIGSTQGYGIAWNGSYWLGLGYTGNTIAVSYNGYNWTSSINDLHFDGRSDKAAWTGSQWIVVGQTLSGSNPTIVLSKDGYNWIPASNTPFPTGFPAQAIASRRVLPYVGTQIIPNALTTRYNSLYPSIWASPQPSTIQSAIDRLAILLSTFTTSNIP